MIKVGGKKRNVVSTEGIPTGPDVARRYFLGADQNGRDITVRLLYGGRNSLLIGFVATLITMFLAMMIGIVGRLLPRRHRRRHQPLFWICCGRSRWCSSRSRSAPSLALGGLNLGPFTLKGNSLLVPALIIGVVYVLYVARPIRGQVLGAARARVRRGRAAAGARRPADHVGELLPNLASTMLVFFPLMLANAILLEAGLSYLGAGVQPPNPSWGTMIGDGIRLILSAPPDDRARRSCSCSPCSRSTSSATACATRSTRARKVRLEH